MLSDGLVREKTIERVKHDLLVIGRIEASRRLKAVEPALWFASTRAAVDASGLFDDASNHDDMPTLVYQAVERALLVLIEAMRREQYLLWADMAIGTRLAALDPDLPRRSHPRGVDAPPTGEGETSSQ